MKKVSIEIDEPLLLQLNEIAENAETSLSATIVDLLYDQVEYLFSDEPGRPAKMIVQLESAAVGERKFSSNLSRAFMVASGLKNGGVTFNTLSLLFGMLSQPYCVAAVLLKEKLDIPKALEELEAELGVLASENSKLSIQTMQHFMSSKPEPSYPEEERLVFLVATDFADGELSTKVMLKAILKSPKSSAARYLFGKGIKHDDFAWL